MSFHPPTTPYPPDRYTAAAPELTARVRRHDAPHDLGVGDSSCDYLATGATTGGDFGLYRWNMAAGQGGPEPHFHRTMSESFYVTSGEITIFDGSEWLVTRPGDYVYVPEGGSHGFRNDSDAAATMLILFAPGAAREAYFEGLQHIARTGERPSADEMAEFFRLHDTYWIT